MPPDHQTTLLLVEDDPGHARLIEKNLRRTRLACPLRHVSDGQAALDFIYGSGTFCGETPPRQLIVLLDINMPGLDGFQVLEQIKTDPRTRTIPVIILTTTDDEREERRCYELGCDLYITKPVDYAAFSEVVQRLGVYLSQLAVSA